MASSRIEPELVELIEEIVARRVKAAMEERAKLVTEDKFAAAIQTINDQLEEAREDRKLMAKRLDKVDQRFEEARQERELMAKRLDKVDQRFEEARQERERMFEEARQERERMFEEARKERKLLAKRLEVNSTRLEENSARLETVVHTQGKMLSILENLQHEMGVPFEQFGRNVVSRILEGEGAPMVSLKKHHLEDPEHHVWPGTTDVEIDGYSENPPVIVEITAVLRDREKVDGFLKKKALVEARTGKTFRGFFLASGTSLSREEVAEITVDLHKAGCELLRL